jgi:hypothetical protein
MQVAALAARHRVEGLTNAALELAGVAPPAEEAEAFKRNAMLVARRSLTQAAESARLQTLLDGAGVNNLLLKGAALEALVYGALGRKDAWDIDVLVARRMVGSAITCLTRGGYDLTEPPGLSPAQFDTYVRLARECELRHRDTGVTVELHWGLADGPVLLTGLGVDSSSQWTEAGALRFRTLGRKELFAYLCVHGAMHGWARLKWLADLAAMIADENDESLARLVDRARTLGAGAAPDQALALIQHLFDFELGPRTLARLRHGLLERWLVSCAIRVMSGTCEPREDRVASALTLASQFALCGGWRGAVRQAAYRFVSVHDRIHVPLPAWLHFLYPILRAPLWLWRRLSEL